MHSLHLSPSLSLSGSVGRLWPSGSLAGVDGAVGRGQGSCAGSRLSVQSASACLGSPTGSWHHAAGISPNYNYQLQLQMETSRRTSPCILHGLQPPPHSSPHYDKLLTSNQLVTKESTSFLSRLHTLTRVSVCQLNLYYVNVLESFSHHSYMVLCQSVHLSTQERKGKKNLFSHVFHTSPHSAHRYVNPLTDLWEFKTPPTFRKKTNKKKTNSFPFKGILRKFQPHFCPLHLWCNYVSKNLTRQHISTFIFQE